MSIMKEIRQNATMICVAIGSLGLALTTKGLANGDKDMAIIGGVLDLAAAGGYVLGTNKKSANYLELADEDDSDGLAWLDREDAIATREALEAKNPYYKNKFNGPKKP